MYILKCTNNTCHFYNNPISWPEDREPAPCPLCHSVMTIVDTSGENAADTEKTGQGNPNTIGWLAAIASNREYWHEEAETAYPAVIAHEYRNLREYCRKEEPYAVLLSLKDNFEALLKLEVLLAYAWAAKYMDEAFQAGTVCRLMTQNLSMGSWLELASIIEKNLNQTGVQLPEAIPLASLRQQYLKSGIVGWRNTNIGHGAMSMEADEEFRKDIRDKIMLLKELFESMDRQLKDQELYLPAEADAYKELPLTGAGSARGLARKGEVYFRSRNGEPDFCIDPFMVIRKHEKNGYGIYFFDNQKTKTLTHFLAYAEGTRVNESIGYFERLSRQLETAGLDLEAMAGDIYLTEDEVRELDILHMSHNFVKPEHLVGWLKECTEKHDRGVFLLQMERGTGKSVFAERLNCLTHKYVKLSDNLDVRTYHISRTQSAGSGDLESGIEWQWERDYEGKTWPRAPKIRDFEKDGKTPGEALCGYLGEVHRYSKRNRNKERLLMVFDGLDEIKEEDIWKYIPDEEMLEEGIYILLTSRNPETEDLPEKTVQKLKSLKITESYRPGKQGSENAAFLNEYIKKTGLKGLSREETEELIRLSGHMVLTLGMLCRLAESGMAIDELPDSGRVVSVYLDTLEKRYGEKESIRFRELLAVLCTLGSYEGLSLETLGTLTCESGISLRLVGMLRDLSPMLKTERGERGNLYMIANPDLAGELEKQIPETEDTVRWIINLTLSAMEDDNLLKEKELEVSAAHVAELAMDKLTEGIEAIGETGKDILLTFIQYFNSNVKDYYDRKRIIDYQKQVYLCYRGILGDNNYKTLFFKSELANKLMNLGHYEEALNIYQEVYNKEIEIIGEEHPLTLMVKTGLSGALRALGRYNDALSLIQEAYEAEKRVFGAEHSETLSTKYEIAYILGDLGKYKEAMDILKELLEQRIIVLGENHPTILSIKKQIAIMMCKLGQDKLSLPIFEEIYEKEKRVLSDTHPHTLTTQNNIASSLRKLGQYNLALPVFEELYEKRKKVLGIEHSDTLLTKNQLANTLGGLGRYEEAFHMLMEVSETGKTVLGEDHPQVLDSKNDLAVILIRLGRYEEALSLIKEIKEKYKSVYGKKHPNTLMALQNMASILGKLGHHEEGLQIEIEVLEIQREVYGEKHPNTLITKYNLAHTLGTLGYYKEEHDVYQDVHTAAQEILGEKHPLTLSTIENLAYATYQLGDYVEALRLFMELYTKKKTLLGENHPDIMKLLNNIKAIIEKHEMNLTSDGRIYEGEIENGKPCGKGKMIYPDGSKYEGGFKDGIFNGIGKLTLVNGMYYECEFINGKMNGKGIAKLPNGDIYEGGFVDNKLIGYAKMRYSSGPVYEGEWNEGENGFGRMIYPNGEVYEGEWKDGFYNGHGKMINPKGHIGYQFEGEFVHGKIGSYGIYKWPNGAIYEGEFKESKKNGHGKMTYPDGSIYEGEWKDDEPL